jgi:hypothetical protein
MKRRLALLAAVVLLAAIGLHLAPQLEEVRQLGRLSPLAVVGSVGLLLGSHLAQNESMLRPLRTHLPRLGFWELFLVRTGGLVVGSSVPVAGGLAVRLAYLRRLGLSFSAFAHATALSNLLALVAAACLALPAAVTLWMVAGPPPTAAIWLLAALSLAGAAALVGLQTLPRLTDRRWLPRWLRGVEPGWASRRVSVPVFWACLFRHVFSFSAFGVLYSALSPVPGGFLAGGLVYTLTTPVRMVNLTPGNVGVNEWAAATAGQALSFDLTTGLLVGGVFRVASLVAQGCGVVVGWAFRGPGASSTSKP